MISILVIGSACGEKSKPKPYIPPEVDLTDIQEPQKIPSIDERLNELSQGLQVATIQCPEKLWPGFNFANLKLVVTQVHHESAWEWEAGDSGQREFSEIDFHSLPQSWKNAYFLMDKDEEIGKYILVLSLPKTSLPNLDYKSRELPEYLVGLGIHEGFHLIEQENWVIESTTKRSTQYPLDATPRFLRYMMNTSLSESLAGNAEKLSEARYWYDRYESEFPEEANSIRFYDKIEGSARYVEHMANAIVHLGCDASDDELFSWSFQKFYSRSRPELKADIESYRIGSKASLLLRQSEKHSGWENIISETTSSQLDLLLEDIVPKVAEDDISLFKEVNEMIDYKNSELKALIDPWLEARSSNEFYSVLISGEMMGSFNVSDFIILKDGGHQLRLNFSARFIGKQNQGDIKVTSMIAEAIDNRENPCGIEGVRLFLPSTWFESILTGASLNVYVNEFEANEVSFNFARGDDGKGWICL
ncbi:MAG: hypothetical protein ACOH5I_24490 [Oligoflexus sp.]